MAREDDGFITAEDYRDAFLSCAAPTVAAQQCGHHQPGCGLDREAKMITVAEGVFCDPCIAPLVAALNAAGVETIASCCGHTHRPGCIALRDGRELIIAQDYDEARKIEAMSPVDINGNTAPSTITPAEVGGLVDAPVGFMRPKDIQRLAEVHSGAITVQIANLSFGGWTEPVYAAAALSSERAAHAETKRERDEAVNQLDSMTYDRDVQREQCKRLLSQRDEALKALEQIERKICAAEHGHTINDVLANYRDVRRAVQDARAAAAPVKEATQMVDDTMPRYTTKRLKHEIERARENDQREIAILRTELEQVKRELDEANAMLADAYGSPVEGHKLFAERLAGARVKPLEWRGTEGVWAKADALFGATYRITEYAGMAKPFKLETVGFVGPSGHYELIDDAKAAAQADYERRILSALAKPAGEAESVADEDEREDRIAALPYPDEAPASEVLSYVLSCARLWAPEARIIGNARAGDIVRALTTPPDASAIRGDPIREAARILYYGYDHMGSLPRAAYDYAYSGHFFSALRVLFDDDFAGAKP